MRSVLSCLGIAFAIDTSLENAQCFCELSGYLDDCFCQISELDKYNNEVIYPHLASIVQRDFFRYYKANTKRKCKFWDLDFKCRFASGGCTVLTCPADQVPSGIKGVQIPEDCDGQAYNKTRQIEVDKMSFVNRSITEEQMSAFKDWKNFDMRGIKFCDVDSEEDPNMEFIDLIKNPERFTGYDGESAHKVWRAIYEENCFQPEPWPMTQNELASFNQNYDNVPDSPLSGLCLEKKIFYRVVSGLHSSISLHLAAVYRYEGTFGKIDWKMNLEEFKRRFDHPKGATYLKNLYFVYLLEMRAFAKAAPYFSSLQYFTGNKEEDAFMKESISKLLESIIDFPMHFDETQLFKGERANILKEEFRSRFHNVTTIIDCAACEKCRLWGKLQTHGLGTALKILFTPAEVTDFKLDRNEVVAMYNAFARLSSSIHYLESFQKMLQTEQLSAGSKSSIGGAEKQKKNFKIDL